MTHMPIKFAWCVDVGSACVDIWPSTKMTYLFNLNLLLLSLFVFFSYLTPRINIYEILIFII